LGGAALLTMIRDDPPRPYPSQADRNSEHGQ
jgi:hypothetical protein